MSTTIRIENAMKERIAAVARRAGKSPHAFMLDAIVATVEHAELDDAFHAEADARWREFLARGESVPWDETRRWLEARARGETSPQPTPRRFEG
jgi:predicted transcriptional regulator